MASDKEMIATPQSVGVSLHVDVIRIELRCGDAYEAAVLFDDITERAKSGCDLTLAGLKPSENGQNR